MSRQMIRMGWILSVCSLMPVPLHSQAQDRPRKPRVIAVGVNGAEWDIIRPLLVRGEMPNLARVIARGVSGKLRTISAPNCPKVYSVLETSTPPEETVSPASWCRV